MSNKYLVTIYDRAVEACGPVMTVHTRSEAIRTLRDAVNDPNTMLHKHPTDYELWLIAEYNDTRGEIVMVPRETLGRAEDFKE